MFEIHTSEQPTVRFQCKQHADKTAASLQTSLLYWPSPNIWCHQWRAMNQPAVRGSHWWAVVLSCIEQKVEPFPIRAQDSSWLCLWAREGLVQNRASLGMVRTRSPGSLRCLGAGIWGREESYLDKRLTSDLGLILQPCPNLACSCVLSSPRGSLSFLCSSRSTAIC